MPKILIIDDDPFICKTLVKVFTRMDHEVRYSLSLKQGIDDALAEQFDVIFLDVNLPDGNGLEAIKIIKQRPTAPEIIIMTGDSNPEGAVLAMESRAWDYIQKSGSQKEFNFSLARALEYRQQKQSNAQKNTIFRGSIIGESRSIVKCMDQVSRAADNDLPVLITGDTGTGKELFSKAIHNNGNRSQAEFVVVDCTSLPEHLVESTLFGHTKGAFTGADSNKTGLMEMADKGTLFLDEVGELPLNIQKKFLRALQEKRFRPLGSKKEIKSDFRLISATHRDLTNMVKHNQFREDLFFRMFSMNIHLPPLKDREGDAVFLALHHLAHKKGMEEENSCVMSPEFIEEIQNYEWPGNVRDLFNTLDLVCSDAGEGSTLFPHHLPGHIRAFNIRKKFKTPTDNASPAKVDTPVETATGEIVHFKDHIEKTKSDYLQNLLSSTEGNIKEACKTSGLSRSQLYRLMHQFNL